MRLSVMAPPKIQAAISTGYTVSPGGPNQLPLRGFDRDAKSFNPNGEVVLELPADSVRGVIDVGLGRNFLLTQSKGLETGGAIDPVQLFVEVKAGCLHASAGKRVTTANYETIWPINPTISRSWLFHNAIPYTGTGVRVGCGNSSVDTNLEIDDGWDRVVGEGTPRPSYLGNLALNGQLLSLNATYLTGPDGPEGHRRQLVDTLLTYRPSSTTTLALNYDYGTERDKDDRRTPWQGAAAYFTFSNASNSAAATVRTEYFQDPDGVRTGTPDLKLLGLTVEGEVEVAPSLRLRAEGRRDQAVTGFPFHGSDHLSTVALEALYLYSSP